MKIMRLVTECRKRFYNIKQEVPEAGGLAKDGRMM
jgi:hypothetical protein